MFTKKVFMESPVEKLKVTSGSSVITNCIHCICIIMHNNITYFTIVGNVIVLMILKMENVKATLPTFPSLALKTALQIPRERISPKRIKMVGVYLVMPDKNSLFTRMALHVVSKYGYCYLM